MSSKSQRREREQRARAARIEAEGAERATAARRRRVQVATIAVLALALVAVLIVVSQVGGGGEDSDAPPGLFDGVEQSGTALGDPDAPYTLVEFGDPQCPFCAQFDREVVPRLVSDYVRAGMLRIEFLPLTFIGPGSEAAARMALAVGEQGHFWEFLDLLYRNQETENSGYIDDSFLASLAERIPGVDVRRALDGHDSPRIDEELSRAQGRARDFGISSTPSFLVGRTGERPQPLDVDSLDPDAFAAALDARIGGNTGG